MKKNNKKGFTIVELVIVIAVIAILAAVLIPTFSSIIKKAKVNNDIQLVRNLNTALAADTKEHKTMQSALDAAAEFGYDVAKINASATDNEILWDSVNNVFCYLNTEKNALEYIPSSVADDDKLSVDSYLLWKISDTVDATYSTYYVGSETTINTTKGFDAGKTTGITAINYTNKNSPQNVVIRTNGEDCVLTINAPSDTVAHYGFASKTNVVAVDKEHCYNENGTSATLVIKSGKVVLAPTAVVFELKKENDFDSGSTFENNGGFVAKADAGTLQEQEYIANIYNVGTLNQLEAFRDAVNSGMNFNGITIKLTADITLNKAWRPISNYSRTEVYGKGDTSTKIQSKLFNGTFDGQGHTIYGLTNVGVDDTTLNKGTNATTIQNKLEVTYGLFASIGNATIKDLKLADVNIVESFSNNEKFVGDCVGAVTGFVFGSATFENITVSGSVVASDNVGGLVGRVYNYSTNDFTVNFNNCTNNATVKSTAGSGKAAGIACLTMNGTGTLTVNFNNCTNTATIETNTEYYAGIAYNGGAVKVKLDGCQNTGANTSGRMYFYNNSSCGDNGSYNY